MRIDLTQTQPARPQQGATVDLVALVQAAAKECADLRARSQVVSVKQASEDLGMSQRWVRDNLPLVEIGNRRKVQVADVINYIERHKER